MQLQSSMFMWCLQMSVILFDESLLKMLLLKNTCNAHFVACNVIFNMRVALHVKLISVTIHLYSVRRIEMLCRATYHWFSLSFFCSVTWDNIWGKYSPKYWEFQTKSQTHCLSPIHTISLYNHLSSFLYTYTHSDTSLHTHIHMLNHNRDTEIPTCALLYLPIQTEHTHTCTCAYCSTVYSHYTMFPPQQASSYYCKDTLRWMFEWLTIYDEIQHNTNSDLITFIENGIW